MCDGVVMVPMNTAEGSRREQRVCRLNKTGSEHSGLCVNCVSFASEIEDNKALSHSPSHPVKALGGTDCWHRE